MTTLRHMLRTAREFTEPDVSNTEYIRGQAELICSLTGISTDEKETVMDCISHGISVSAAVDLLKIAAKETP